MFRSCALGLLITSAWLGACSGELRLEDIGTSANACTGSSCPRTAGDADGSDPTGTNTNDGTFDPNCTPRTSCGENCGPILDGCGGTLDCGVCPGVACNNGIDDDGDGLVDWQYDQGCYDSTDNTESGVATGVVEKGWTAFEPSPSTTIIYVSSSEGSDSNDGLSPSSPKASIQAGIAATSNGDPDWVLLKRGDVWNEDRLSFKNGESATRPWLMASYGSSTARPLVKTGTNSVTNGGQNVSHVAIVGIHFYANGRDPNSPDFATWDSDARGWAQDGGTNILLEDNYFDFYIDNINIKFSSNIKIRRNIVTNSYSNSSSHSQGIFTARNTGTYLLEGNVVDHNGWYQPTGNGDASNKNHNSYVYTQGITGGVIRNNIYNQGSSICMKMSTNFGEIVEDWVIENNLLIDCEVGISAAGNDSTAYRVKNWTIRDNVITDMGRTAPTGRNLAWGIEMLDWDGGLIDNNLIMNAVHTQGGSGIRFVPSEGGVTADTRNVTVSNNVLYDVAGNPGAFFIHGNINLTGISFSDNTVQQFFSTNVDGNVVEADQDVNACCSWSRNLWYSFKGSPFEIPSGNTGYSGFANASGDTGGAYMQVGFTDPNRDVAGYSSAQGRARSIDAFIDVARLQQKRAWNPSYHAPNVNDWLRTGFDMTNP